MSENRCERCNRKLKDPNAQYGWRCAEILGISENLNYSGDSAFDRYLSGISAADSFLADNRIDKKSVNQASFYEAMAKRYLSADMHNHALWKAAYIQSENALKGNESTNNTPLSEYFDMRDAYDYKNGDYQTTKYLDGTYSEDTKKLQHALNEIGIKDKFGNRLKEDGLNGPKTQRAIDIFLKGNSHVLKYNKNAFFPKNMELTLSKNYKTPRYLNAIFDISLQKKKQRLFQIDYGSIPGHTEAQYHINVKALDDALPHQKSLANSLDHTVIPKTVYDSFKDFEILEKISKTGGKALTVLGYVFDAVDFTTAVYRDLNDEDKTLGKTTASSAAGIAGSWAGGAAGAKLGAMGGASIGTFILPGLGTAVGGFLGGLGGGMAGSIAGRKVGEIVIDKTYEEDWMKRVQ